MDIFEFISSAWFLFLIPYRKGGLDGCGTLLAIGLIIVAIVMIAGLF